MKRNGFGALILALIATTGTVCAGRVCTEEEYLALDIDGRRSRFLADAGPWLQSLSQTSVVVQWNFREPESSWVIFETGQRVIDVESPEVRAHHAVAFCDLTPETTYHYSVHGGEWFAFTTLPSPGAGSLRFAAFGDYGENNPNQKAIIDQLWEFDPQLIVTTGDNAYDRGKYIEIRRNVLMPFWGLLATRAFYPALGDHDVDLNAGMAYLDIFTLPHNNAEQSERYYSFDAGPVHFTMLDSASDDALRQAGSAQLTWLEQDLSATDQPWKVVMLHHSPFSTENRRGSDKEIREMTHSLFQREGVDLVLSGDSHHYERTRRGGVVYIVTGGGGKSTRGHRWAWTPVRLAYGKARKKCHFLGVTADEKQVTVLALDREGRRFDRVLLKRDPSAD